MSVETQWFLSSALMSLVRISVTCQSSTYISKLHLSNLSQGRYNLATDFVGDIQLYHAHVRRPEHGILCGRHGKERRVLSPRCERCDAAMLLNSQASECYLCRKELCN